MVRSSSGHAVDLAVHDGQVAHQLLDDIGDQGRVVGFPQPGQLVGVLQQRHGSQRDHVGRGFVTGLQQNRAVHGRGRAVELASGDVVGDQPAHQVVARFALLAVPPARTCSRTWRPSPRPSPRRSIASRVRSCCGAGRTRGPRRARRAAARSPARAPAARKSRTRSAGGPAVDHVVQESVDQLLDLRTHRLGSPKGEVPGHHSPQSVVLGIVDAREDHRHVVVGALQLQRIRKRVRATAADRSTPP